MKRAMYLVAAAFLTCSFRPIAAAPPPPPPAAKKLAVIMWAKTSTTPLRTPQYVRDYFTNVGNFWAEDSYGIFTMDTTTVYGPYFGHTEIHCFNGPAIRALAAADGYNAADFWSTMYLGQDCGADDGYEEGVGSWPYYRDLFQHTPEQMPVGPPNSSGTYACRNSANAFVTFPDDGNSCSYDRFGALGMSGSGDDIGLGHHPAQNKQIAGWLVAGNVTTVNTTGTYHLKPLEYPTTGPLMLNVYAKNSTSMLLYRLEYRQPSPFEFQGTTYGGPILYLANGIMLDASPDGLFGINGGSPTLNVGHSVTDGTVTFTTLSADSGDAVVSVDYGDGGQPTCQLANPTLTISPSSVSGAPGGGVTFNATITNNNTNCDPASFNFLTLLQQVISDVVVPSGESRTVIIGLGAGVSPPDTYTVTPTVFNTTQPAFRASNSLTYTLTAVSSAVNFVTQDTTTKGSWHGVYGSDGYSIPGDSESLPSYALFSVSEGTTVSNWGNGSSVELVQNAANTNRIFSFWGLYNNAFTIDLSFTDGQTHPFALYGYMGSCGSGGPDTETVEIVDASNTTVVLDSRSFTPSARYLVWNIKGHVKINVKNAACGAVMNAAFIG